MTACLICFSTVHIVGSLLFKLPSIISPLGDIPKSMFYSMFFVSAAKDTLMSLPAIWCLPCKVNCENIWRYLSRVYTCRICSLKLTYSLKIGHPKKKETSLPTTRFQGRGVRFGEGTDFEMFEIHLEYLSRSGHWIDLHPPGA